MNRRTPYRVDTYCGVCHGTQAHYLRVELGDAKRDCYECVQCLHLVFAPKHKEMGVGWFETRKDKPEIPEIHTEIVSTGPVSIPVSSEFFAKLEKAKARLEKAKARMDSRKVHGRTD